MVINVVSYFLPCKPLGIGIGLGHGRALSYQVDVLG